MALTCSGGVRRSLLDPRIYEAPFASSSFFFWYFSLLLGFIFFFNPPPPPPFATPPPPALTCSFSRPLRWLLLLLLLLLLLHRRHFLIFPGASRLFFSHFQRPASSSPVCSGVFFLNFDSVLRRSVSSFFYI